MTKKEMQAKVDEQIVNLVMEHFNIQSFEGIKEKMTGEEFNRILEVAKDMYYIEIVKHSTHGKA